VRVLGLAFGRAQALAQGGSAVLLALALAAEAAASGGGLLAHLSHDWPHAWALLCPAVTLAGSALAVAVMSRRGEIVALRALGFGFGSVVAAGLLVATLLALLATLLGTLTAPSVEVARVPTGWWIRGAFVADLPDAPALAPPSPLPRWALASLLGLPAAALGSHLGVTPRLTSVILCSALVLVVSLITHGAGG